MIKEIFIDANIHQTRIAVLEDQELVELYIEPKDHETIVGNIYKGRVMNILPGMQAAFINIGDAKNAFLYLDENKNTTSIDVVAEKTKKPVKKIRPGDELLVQVIKDPTGSKGAKVTTEISIPGSFLVLIPGQDSIGISRKIEHESERNRLKQLALRVKPPNCGLILRTNGSGKTESDFLVEIQVLQEKWLQIWQQGQYIAAPGIAYKDIAPGLRAVRDFLTDDISGIVTNDQEEYDRIREAVVAKSPHNEDKISLFTAHYDMFSYYSIEKQIDKALQKHVWLKSGGSIIIEQTEALTVIDVNTGKYTGTKSLQQTVMKINLEAADEAAKQVRLRNISGIIIIDFIDMKLELEKKRVLERLENALKRDRTKTSVVGITELGLVQMTRKKTSEPLSALLLSSCPCCHGHGKILSIHRIVQKIHTEVEYIFSQTIFNYVRIEANQALLKHFAGANEEFKIKLEQKYDKKIELCPVNIKETNKYLIHRDKI